MSLLGLVTVGMVTLTEGYENYLDCVAVFGIEP